MTMTARIRIVITLFFCHLYWEPGPADSPPGVWDHLDPFGWHHFIPVYLAKGCLMATPLKLHGYMLHMYLRAILRESIITFYSTVFKRRVKRSHRKLARLVF